MKQLVDKPCILIVEDTFQNIMILEETLIAEYRLLVATNGLQALEIIRQDPLPDLILLDIMMPQMDGFEVCRQLKADIKTQSIPIIFITALSKYEDENKGLQLSAVDYITKPICPAIVQVRVKNQIELKKHRDYLEELVLARTAEITKTNQLLEQEIEERKRTEKALRESETAYRAFAQIALALTVEKDINRLLEMIVDEARRLTNADAGTLYIMDNDGKQLSFEIMQCESMQIRIRKMSESELSLPKVPLYIDAKPNYANVSSFAALNKKIINIEDVYTSEGFDFSRVKNYDAVNHYRSKSMLVMPLKNHENDVIGVLQLINARGSEPDNVIAFSAEYEKLISALASQAAIAITNTILIKDFEKLFYSFIKSIATAIDAKSPCTAGHIRRVVDFTMLIADAINQTNEGPLADVHFNDEQLEMLMIAAWMHDIGKITTPEHVVEKPTKLQTIFDRIHLIEMRFQFIGQLIETNFYKQKCALSDQHSDEVQTQKTMENKMLEEKAGIAEDLEFIKTVNFPGEFMDDDKVRRIEAIAAKKFVLDDKEHPYLTADEVENLTIRRGTLNEQELKIIENHSRMTFEILNQIHFPKKLAKVPQAAASHHEKLDGSGYHQGLEEKDLPIESKIITIADIFEALTASDRPYRKPILPSKALNIMEQMKKERGIDPNIYDLLVKSKFSIQ